MYLEHFGLNEPPFKITPVTDFFFPGANRAEILDALLYAINESEGVIKVTGEVGSGKTMLCRMLLERFPDKVEAVYLANPSLSREEMLYAIADGLKLNLDGQRVNIILQTLQNHLELKTSQGKRVVILVDEAHAMPLETMEELRLLYNLQVGNHKLLHIVLFGQPELNDKLNQPNMRQLKDRIIHHFSMLPLSQNIIESYLLFRMRTAGYRGPTPFSVAAAALIGKASQGLMRRVNILADKSLLSAFVENTHNVEVRHVQAAIRDSELTPQSQTWWKPKITTGAALVIVSAMTIGAGITWLIGNMYASNTNPAEVKTTVAPVSHSAVTSTVAEVAPSAPPAALQITNPASLAPQPAQSIAEIPKELLLEQRLAATRAMIPKIHAGNASIQLFYTNTIRTARLERFLEQADKLGKLHEIYVIPIKINGSKGLRMLYGVYTNSEEARSSIKKLPKNYLDEYAPAIYLLEAMPAS